MRMHSFTLSSPLPPPFRLALRVRAARRLLVFSWQLVEYVLTPIPRTDFGDVDEILEFHGESAVQVDSTAV